MDDGSLQLDEGRALRAHLLDAHQELRHPATVYLFCKVRQPTLPRVPLSIWASLAASAAGAAAHKPLRSTPPPFRLLHTSKPVGMV